MEQRLLRLGDIVDDYCPRERRITNHAIVAIVEDAIRQTRCTTCDYEHVFKQAREPRRRKNDSESLYDQVLADLTGGQLVAPRADADSGEQAGGETDAAPVPQAAAPPVSVPVPDEGWPAHRTLIRATLPRTDGEPPPPRPIPEFTMHQKPPAPRGRGGFRFNHGQGDAAGFPRDGRPRGGHGGGRMPGQRDGNNAGHGGSGNGQGDGAGSGRSGRRRRRGR